MLNPPRAWTTISPDLWSGKERDTTYIWIKNERWMNLQLDYMGFDMWIIKIMFVFFSFLLCIFLLFFPIFILVPRKSWTKLISKSFSSFSLEAKSFLGHDIYWVILPNSCSQWNLSFWSTATEKFWVWIQKFPPGFVQFWKTRKTSPKQHKFLHLWTLPSLW